MGKGNKRQNRPKEEGRKGGRKGDVERKGKQDKARQKRDEPNQTQ